MKHFLFYLFFIFCATCYSQRDPEHQKQPRFSSEFVHHATELYDWNSVEKNLAADLNINIPQASRFLDYVFHNGFSSMEDYLNKVQTGTVNSSNANQYWLDQLPNFKQIYYSKYIPSTKKSNINTGSKKGINQVLTGGENCNNLDFTDGTTGWNGEWNDAGGFSGQTTYGDLTAFGLNSSSGLNSMGYVQELCGPGNDPNVPISRVPPGHTSSLRLGNDSAYQVISDSVSTGFYPHNHQTISNTFLVTDSNKSVSYWYAVVLCQYSPNNHDAFSQPYFNIRMYDGSGNEIVCAQYDVDAMNAPTIGGFDSVSTVLNFSGSPLTYTFFYKDWNQVMIPLSNYVGQNVTLTFETSDCAPGGHSAYAYIAVDCASLPKIAVSPIPCQGGTGSLTGPAGAATYTWSGPGIVGSNTSQTIQVNTGGNYSVTMTTLGNSGLTCSFSVDTTISAPPAGPAANFSYVAICSSAPVQFTDLSLANGGSITSWLWDFGDGTQSNQSSPSHAYTTGGTYQCTLTITSSTGCTNSQIIPVTLNSTPTAAFTYSSPCLGSVTTFTNTSSILTGTYNWNFGDPGSSSNVSSLLNPNFQYNSTGTYTVTLSIDAGNNCAATTTNVITITPTPSATASSPPSFCSGDIIPAASVISNPTSGVTYVWTNNNTQTGMSASGTGIPSSFFSAAANNSGVVVSGIVSITPYLNGCPGAITTYTLQVKPKPALLLPVINFCPNETSTVINLTSSPSDPSTIYNWTNTTSGTFIGLTTTQGSSSIPSFTTVNTTSGPQTNVISVNVSLNGCPGNTASFPITVNPLPAADFSHTIACMGNQTDFSDQSTIGGGSITNWNWDLDGNGLYNDASGTNISNVFSSGGSHTVGLEVLSDKGCRGSYSEVIYVNNTPLVDLTGDVLQGCPKHVVNFSSTTSIPLPEHIVSYNWDFGNGTNSSTPSSVTASYDNGSPVDSALYTVSLEVTSDSGCIGKAIKTNYIRVFPKPLANFSWSPTDVDILDPTVSFVNQSIGANGPQALLWYLGDQSLLNDSDNYSTLISPIHLYPNEAATYNVSQWVSNVNGCKDSITKTVTINGTFTFYIPNAFSPNPFNDLNNGFKGTGIGIDNTSYSLLIFDRWGNMIFESHDLEEEWDSTFKGKFVQSDVYVWRANFNDLKGMPHQYRGTVTVVR